MLTEEEKNILRNTHIRFNYIARHKCGLLVLFPRKPRKVKSIGEWVSKHVGEYWFGVFNHLFQSVQWTDKKPLEFRNEKGEFIL